METNTFEQAIEQMRRERGMPLIDDRVQLNIEGADLKLYKAALYHFQQIGEEFIPMKQYREVSDWLENNQGKGLLLYGNHGRGKTILAKHLIPNILLYYAGLVANFYTATEIGQKLDEALQKKILVIDDMGTEGQLVDYGNRRNVMDEIMDAVEQKGKLIIITTNLSGDKIRKNYGAGVYDRIVATTKRVLFQGSSFRG